MTRAPHRDKVTVLMNRDIFEGLFVLELANNHLGKLERGLKIITDYSRIVRFNNVKAAIKLQFRDVDRFIHKDYKHRTDLRYIKKTLDTQLPKEAYVTMVNAIKDGGCIPMATAFDEKSVDLCVELGLPLIKIASSDLNDWPLLEKMAKTRKPCIVSTGGSSLKDMDDIVTFFQNRNIPLAINHCVSLYPSEDRDLELNQIDFLRNRYPNHVIGFSSHEYHDWHSSLMMAYAKGARTFERHIDIEYDNVPVSKYNSLPHQCDEWFKAWHKAQEMCGGSGATKRIPSDAEIKYLDALVRGVYAKKDLPAGHVLQHADMAEDIYLAVPLLRGQVSCREIMNGEVLLKAVKKDDPITIDSIDSPYSSNEALKKTIYDRGIDPEAKPEA